jgi:hypothetical protein
MAPPAGPARCGWQPRSAPQPRARQPAGPRTLQSSPAPEPARFSCRRLDGAAASGHSYTGGLWQLAGAAHLCAPLPPTVPAHTERQDANKGVGETSLRCEFDPQTRLLFFYGVWSIDLRRNTENRNATCQFRVLLAHRAFAVSCRTDMCSLALARRGRTCRVATIFPSRENPGGRESRSWDWESRVRFQPDKLTSRSIESKFVFKMRRAFLNASTESPACCRRPPQYGGTRMPEATQDFTLAMWCARGMTRPSSCTPSRDS